jgi:hypothetical protein
MTVGLKVNMRELLMSKKNKHDKIGKALVDQVTDTLAYQLHNKLEKQEL